MSSKPGVAIATAAALLGLSLTAGAAPASRPSPDRVQVQTGVLQGVRLSSGTVAFLGVPYAAPPVGPLRFRPPRPAPAWQGVRPAQSDPKGCMRAGLEPERSEDCLYLNVYVPSAAPPAGKKYPVVIWFHGGAGRVGGDRNNGIKLAAKGVVVVAANWRLGVLGSLATPELSAESPRHISGNQNRLDAIMALQWIHDNIAAVGGDPSNVTLSGQSGGGLTTATLQTSPLARPLFHKVLGDAASVFGMDQQLISPLKEAEDRGARFMQDAKLDLAGLRALSTEQFLALPALKSLPGQGTMVVDGYMLKEHPRDAFMAGRAADVPALLGAGTEENIGSLMRGGVKTKAEFDAKLAAAFAKDPEGLAEVHRLYPLAGDAEARRLGLRLNTELDVTARMRTWAHLLATHNKSPVWLYNFNVPVGGDGVVKHGDDVAFWFCTMDAPSGSPMINTPPGYVPNRTPEDYALCDRMMEAAATFYRTGNPNTAAVRWPRYDAKTEQLIEFDKPRDRVLTVSPRVLFWVRKAKALFGYDY